MPASKNVSDFVERELHDCLADLEARYDAHAITFVGPIMGGVDDLLRTSIEARYKIRPTKNKLIFLLTTEGGYIEVVQRIVATLRKHYRTVEFIVPNSAYSAGTVLALSGDAIHMDYYSRLGPIDPQVRSASGKMIPALGYLKRYEQLIEKAADGTITVAEVQILVQGFDQAELDFFDHARKLSITLLEEWLVKYKFKGWTTTATRGLTVTKAMKKARAVEIAETLNDTDKWHSHGHGISMMVLTKDLNVIIDDFGKDDDLSASIRNYDGILTDYMRKIGTSGAIHFNETYIPFM